MEDIRNIADETFPSFLANSITSHAGEILDNITISSNFGLPVAASTEARQRTSSYDRLCDQISYTERKFLASSNSGESDPDPRRKLILNFQDTVENHNKVTETHLELDQNESNILQRRQSQNCTDTCSGNSQDILHEKLSLEHQEDLTTITFAALGKDSEGHKVASLESGQNWITSEMGDNAAVTGFSRFIENEKLLSFTSLEEHSTDDDLGDEEFCDEQLEAYFEQLVLPEMEDIEERELGEYIEDVELPTNQEKFQIPSVCRATAGTDSPVPSDKESYDLKGAGHKFIHPMTARQEEEECCKSSLKSGHSGSSDKSHVGIIGDASEVHSRTLDSQHTTSDVKVHFDSGGEPFKINIVDNSRNESEGPIAKQTTDNSYYTDVTNVTNSELKLDSLYFKCTDDKAASEIQHVERQSQFSHLCQIANESYIPLADVYPSPRSCRSSKQYQCTTEEIPPHNVVYQNEEGRWVTDLAYYTSFNEEQAFNLSSVSGDFITGTDAIAMFVQDQEEFEREHKFMQEEKMDPQNTSALGDSSWKSVNSYNPLKVSETEFSKDASFLRLSLGEFFGQRSEALGCLGGGGDVKRPSFGYYITSPEKRQPVPLLRQSDVSRANSDEPNLQISDPLQESLKEESHTESTTFTHGEMGTQTRENRSEKVEETKVKSEHNDLDPSLLSISTIASAIADASLSAEPSQLAALMMKLSNKHKEKTNIQEMGRLPDLSVISQLLSSNVEDNTFDIEKYLRRTDVGNNNEPESIVKHEETATDCHRSLYKQESEMGNADLLNFYIQYGKNKQHLEKIYEENDSSNLPYDISSSEQKRKTECIDASSNINEHFQSKMQASTVPGLKKKLSETSLNENVTTSSTYSKLEGRANKNTLPFNSKSVPVLISPLAICPEKEKATCQVNNQNEQDRRILKENATCNSENHVTFENAVLDNQEIPEEAVIGTEQKLATAMQLSDDEQCSFRPSTSPLIHSSPSEASGTSLSGSDFPCTTLNCKKIFCDDSALPQSIYSDPSLERLTFVSATENTLKNLALSTPERYQSNRASELSTTVVWTSPTSLLEQETGKCIALQNRQYPSLSTSAGSHDKKQEINESATLARQHEDQKSTGEFLLESEDPSAINCQNNNERCQVDTPKTQHELTHATNGLGLSSLKHAVSSNSIDGCNSGNQSKAQVKTHCTASQVPEISAALPTLLTGCSLSTTPFAQQYLGTLSSQANIALPQYHVGCPPVFGVPAGLIYSSIPMGHIQNSLTARMTVGSDVGSGMSSTTPHCNFTSNQNIFSSGSYAGQAAGPGNPGEWGDSVPFGFVHVKVPEEVKFPGACCVGLTSHTVLSIFNPSERWLQVSIHLLGIMLDGLKMDISKHRCLLFKNKTVIGPCATEELKILFLPCQAGVFQCILSVAAWPFSADADAIIQAEALASRVIVNAVAENPDIEVEAGKANHLDFGDLPSGSWKALPLKLTNKTHARVPIRLVIHANAIAWRCFTFSKEPIGNTLPAYNISQLAAPSVISHVMNACCDGQDPEVLVVWVQFRAPSKCTSSDSLGPPDEYFARIDVEVDCPEPGNVLRNVPLSARSGTPRVYAPKGLQTLYMSAKMGSSVRQQLPLKNAGNIKVDLKIMTLEPGNSISVKPEHLILKPEEEQEVTVEFCPKDYRNVESVVKILVLPSGPEYKVTVKGDVSVEESRHSVQKCPSSDVPPILANKQLLAWGGVQLGRTVQQKLILRNGSPSTTQQLRMLIRGQDQDCFQLKLGDHMYNNCEIKIRPKHDYSVCLTFSPSRLACMFAKLEMKQLGLLSQLGIKFTIPLYGYGGKSNVILEDVKKQSNGYVVELCEPSSGKSSQASFSVHNTGYRAAFVKVLCYKNFCEKITMDPNVLRIFPDKFVLKESSQQKVTITYNSTEEQNNSLVLSTICFFYGDEISRQQYRRAMQHNPEQVQKILPANNPVIDVKFDEELPGEELVTEVYDLPEQPNDLQCFFTNMRRIFLSVVYASTSTVSDAKPALVHHVALQRSSIPEKPSMTLDVLPVKGPVGCALSSKASGLDEIRLVSQDTWSLQPEFLIFTAPSQSGTTVTKYAQITNNSNRSLKFELSWPAHCLTITPQLGDIEPGASISIHVSPNPSLAENKSVFPWSGLIYIHCDERQKLIKVQIRENTSEKPSGKDLPVAKEAAHDQHPELPVIHIRPLQKPPSTKLEIKNRTVFFPETGSGKSSEKYIEIENNGDENVKWILSSFAPTYVKDVDESGEVYRATYTTFQCSCLSGTLEAHGKQKVKVTFLPRDRGQYSQFWDLECHPIHHSHVKDKHRLQFCGMGILQNEALKEEGSKAALVKIRVQDVSQRRDYSDIFEHKIWKGVCAQEDVYTFPPTRIGESSTLKICVRNYSTSPNRLKFRSPREPFYIKHFHYNLRCYHYCNLPVQFKPMSSGTFKGVLVVETDKSGTLTIQLLGEGLSEQ
ncbi:centrosomal protein of 192 kDa isoform X2 [Varanus komodoensis]|uniref:centrosomal protein of 192 kDa isoform X2 n=1 Tax=Varanus komodoensis TaxID=61221 RepID=UPI001CF7AA3B|nr:centrosomal protein of 192 kDa isoform X2 [Varanus komodoensis]